MFAQQAAQTGMVLSEIKRTHPFLLINREEYFANRRGDSAQIEFHDDDSGFGRA